MMGTLRNFIQRLLERESLAALAAPMVAAWLSQMGASDPVICLVLAVLGSLIWGRSIVKREGGWALETAESTNGRERDVS